MSYAIVHYLDNDYGIQGILHNVYKLRHLMETTVDYVCICNKDVSDAYKRILYRNDIKIFAVDIESILTNAVPKHMSDYLLKNHYFGKFSIFLLSGYDRCVYLDSDLLILETLDPLFSLDTQNETIHMSYDVGMSINRNTKSGSICIRSNIFQAGVIVYTPSQYIFAKTIQVAKEFSQRDDYLMASDSDQNFISYMYHKKLINISVMSMRYNAFPQIANYLLKKELIPSISVIHYIAPPKPWDIINISLNQRAFVNSDCREWYIKWIRSYCDYLTDTLYQGNQILPDDPDILLTRSIDEHVMYNQINARQVIVKYLYKSSP